MSWIEAKSRKQYNRTAYVKKDGKDIGFFFRYINGAGVSEPNFVEGMEIQKKVEYIETPAAISFVNSSLIKIDGALYNVESVLELEHENANGVFRKKGNVKTQLTISRRL